MSHNKKSKRRSGVRGNSNSDLTPTDKLELIQQLTSIIPTQPTVRTIFKSRQEYSHKELLDYYYKKRELCDNLWINDDHDIGHDLFDQIRHTLLTFEESNNPILIVHLFNGGGAIDVGAAIYNLLLFFSKPVITVCEGFTASAAATIFMAGDIRIIKPFIFFLIHEGRFPEGIEMPGTIREYQRFMYGMEQREEAMKHILATRTKLTPELIKKLHKTDHYLANQFLLKYNIATHLFNPKKVKKRVFGNGTLIKKIYLDEFLQASNFYTQPNFLTNLNIKKLIIINIDKTYESTSFQAMLYHLNLMLEIPLEIEFFAPGYITSAQLLFSLFANNSIITQSTQITLNPPLPVKSGFSSNILITAESNIQRTNHFRAMLKQILKSKTKLPPKIIKEMTHKRFDFTAQEAIQYKLAKQMI